MDLTLHVMTQSSYRLLGSVGSLRDAHEPGTPFLVVLVRPFSLHPFQNISQNIGLVMNILLKTIALKELKPSGGLTNS